MCVWGMCAVVKVCVCVGKVKGCVGCGVCLGKGRMVCGGYGQEGGNSTVWKGIRHGRHGMGRWAGERVTYGDGARGN